MTDARVEDRCRALRRDRAAARRLRPARSAAVVRPDEPQANPSPTATISTTTPITASFSTRMSPSIWGSGLQPTGTGARSANGISKCHRQRGAFRRRASDLTGRSAGPDVGARRPGDDQIAERAEERMRVVARRAPRRVEADAPARARSSSRSTIAPAASVGPSMPSVPTLASDASPSAPSASAAASANSWLRPPTPGVAPCSVHRRLPRRDRRRGRRRRARSSRGRISTKPRAGRARLAERRRVETSRGTT